VQDCGAHVGLWSGVADVSQERSFGVIERPLDDAVQQRERAWVGHVERGQGKLERPEHTPCPFKIALKDQHSIPLYVRHARSQASDIIRGTHRLDALRLKLGEKRTNFDRSGN